jgi:hypothetical protein
MSRINQIRYNAACIFCSLVSPRRWRKIPFHFSGLCRAL